MKKYIFFFTKKLDGIYRLKAWTDCFMQVDARRNDLSEEEYSYSENRAKSYEAKTRIIRAPNFKIALDIASTYNF